MNIFMSASIPDPKRNSKYWETSDNVAIRDAVIALSQAVLKHDTLIFGGHPAITPIVRSVAEHIEKQQMVGASNQPTMQNVRVYQSEFFKNLYVEDLKAFDDIVETPNLGDRQLSLGLMRNRMLEDRPLDVAFFIGGMEGVEEEYQLCAQRWPGIPLIPVPTTGAAALILDSRHPHSSKWKVKLKKTYTYLSVFETILGDLRG